MWSTCQHILWEDTVKDCLFVTYLSFLEILLISRRVDTKFIVLAILSILSVVGVNSSFLKYWQACLYQLISNSRLPGRQQYMQNLYMHMYTIQLVTIQTLIMITHPCNINPFALHFYIVELGFIGVYPFLDFTLKYKLWLLVLKCTQNPCFGKIRIISFLSKEYHFPAFKTRCMLYRHVCVISLSR